MAFTIPTVLTEAIRALLCSLFGTINHSSSDTLRPHEVYGLLTDFKFCQIVEQLLTEIYLLEGQTDKLPLQCVDFDFCSLVIFSRGLPLDTWLSQTRSPDRPLSPDFNWRGNFIYFLMLDLQTARMQYDGLLFDELTIISTEHDQLVTSCGEVRKTLSGMREAVGMAECTDTDQDVFNLELMRRLQSSQLLKSWHESEQVKHLVYVHRNLPDSDVDIIRRACVALNDEYAMRIKVMSRRFHVTIEGFLCSKLASDHENEIKDKLRLTEILDEHPKRLCIWHLWSANRGVCKINRTCQLVSAMTKSVRCLQIGPVDNRGGIPEGYSLAKVCSDVRKANESLKQKDSREVTNKHSTPGNKEKVWVGENLPNMISRYSNDERLPYRQQSGGQGTRNPHTTNNPQQYENQSNTSRQRSWHNGNSESYGVGSGIHFAQGNHGHGVVPQINRPQSGFAGRGGRGHYGHNEQAGGGGNYAVPGGTDGNVAGSYSGDRGYGDGYGSGGRGYGDRRGRGAANFGGSGHVQTAKRPMRL